ncbi:MAG: hypothetical protein AB1705_13920 [Verrucomicrobiota bacterium]
MPKWLKFILAVLLLPVCAGTATTLWRVLQASSGADTFWVPLMAGAMCWAVVFLMLPKPMLAYVFGHELTHALWSWLFGGQVKRFKASAKGGHVVVTRTNFLVALAPYFFPLYAFLVVLVFAVGHWTVGWGDYLVWFHLLMGAAYAFHVTLTWHVLQTEQSDITSQGYLFSAVIIFLGNIAVLLVGVPLVSGRVDLLSMGAWLVEDTGAVLHRLVRLL